MRTRPRYPNQTAIVEHFEARWRAYQGHGFPTLSPPHVLAARFEIGATDAARVLSALFGVTISRQLVNHVRTQRKNRKD